MILWRRETRNLKWLSRRRAGSRCASSPSPTRENRAAWRLSKLLIMSLTLDQVTLFLDSQTRGKKSRFTLCIIQITSTKFDFPSFLQVILLKLLTAQVTNKSSYLHTTMQRERKREGIASHCNSKYCRCFTIHSLFVSSLFTCIIVHNIVSFMSLHISVLAFPGYNRTVEPIPKQN